LWLIGSRFYFGGGGWIFGVGWSKIWWIFFLRWWASCLNYLGGFGLNI